MELPLEKNNVLGVETTFKGMKKTYNNSKSCIHSLVFVMVWARAWQAIKEFKGYSGITYGVDNQDMSKLESHEWIVC